jgi:hypothetical protein
LASTHLDKVNLSAEPTFQNRVRQSMVTAAIAISNEGWSGGLIHKLRRQQARAILNDSLDTMKVLYARGVATDASVISDATAAGTVAITGGNAATQQALATDAHIDNAVSGQFNSYFDTET